MKDNLPEINIKGGKEKKGGFLGLLRGAGAGAPGAGGAASGGIGALLAGNMSTIVAVVCAVGIGVGVVADKSGPSPAAKQKSSLSAVAEGKKAVTQAEEYVPAIVRSQEANQASSLSMFTETNKGSGLALADGSAPKKAPETAGSNDKASESAEAPKDGEGENAEGMVDGAMAEAQGQAGLTGNSLSSSLGGGSGKSMNFGSKMGGMGGANSKFSMNGNVGSGFKSMPKFQERQGKLLGMKGASRPVTASMGAGGRGKFSDGTRSWKQARGLWGKQQRAYESGKSDTARATMDAAWEGNTSEGETSTEGGGMDEGIVTSPSLDNVGGGGGGNGGGGFGDVKNPYDLNLEKPCGCEMNYSSSEYEQCLKDKCTDESPWKSMATWCQYLIMGSLALSMIGAALISTGEATTVAFGAGGVLMGIGYILVGLAAAAAVAAGVLAILLETKYKQGSMALMFGLGATVALGAAALAAFGDASSSASGGASWMTAAQSVLGLVGNALGSNAVSKVDTDVKYDKDGKVISGG